MGYRPISGAVPQYSQSADGTSADGHYLKFYASGTTTPLSMATDSAGGTTLAKCALNARGEPISNDADDTTVFIPHLNADYKVVLYANSTDADNNTTANALFVVDSLSLNFLEDTSVATFAALRALDSSTLTDGQVISVTQDGIEAVGSIRTGTVSDDSYGLIVFTDDSNRYWESFGRERVNVLAFAGSPDIGAQINTATAAGFTSLYVPPGSYTQSTALTQNQSVSLYSDYWDEFSQPPVIITRDGDFNHIETTTTFVSLGIEWNGGSVAGGSDGLIMHGKFHFIGRVTSQTGNGLVLSESSASHNLNNSIIGGAFSGNTEAQIVIESPYTSDSDNIDINTLLFKYCRCNSGRIGLHIKGGLWNEYQYINTKGNTEVGTLIEANNTISDNTFRLYNENTAGGVVNFYAVDGWSAFGGTPTQTSSTTFTLVGDQTATFVANGKIKLTDNGVDYYGTIDSAVFSTVTTVTVTVAGSIALTANLTAVATDKANNNFRDNDFTHCRGLTKDDIYTQNSNVFLSAAARQGVMVNSEQPWASYYAGSTLSNVTGNDVAYTLLLDTKIKDTQENRTGVALYNTTNGQSTAPTTGGYLCSGCIRFEGLGASAHTRCQIDLVTTNRTWPLLDFDLDAYRGANTVASLSWCQAVDMDSSETATIVVTVAGGSQDVDISGGSEAQTAQSFRLIC